MPTGPAVQLFQATTIDGAISAIIVGVVILFIAFPIHELAHAWVALKLGDNTAQREGRITLNPFAHLDPWGSLFFLIAGFGWARPVPVNTYKLNGNPKTSMALVALAGPISNLLLAILFGLLYRLVRPASMDAGSGMVTVMLVLRRVCQIAVLLNLLLMFFNFIPIPPLDGSKILVALLPEVGERWLAFMAQYQMLVMAVIFIAGGSVISAIIGPPVRVLGALILGVR